MTSTITPEPTQEWTPDTQATKEQVEDMNKTVINGDNESVLL
jgi:hypothetical protein